METLTNLKDNSLVRWTCAIVFMLFSFLWLYGFEADVLAAFQHVVSEGRTEYHPLLGAVLITIVLQALQLLVHALLRLTNRGHALTYFPSMLALALISAINTDIRQSYVWGFWWILVPLMLAGWAGVCMVVRYIQNVEPDKNLKVFFSRPMWINMLVLSVMMMIVAAVSNTNAVFHYRMKAETCLLRGDYEGALDAGWESLESDADLQMIRMYAMAQRGELGQRLFHYPIVGGSNMMLPTSGATSFVRYPVDSLYRALGARPARKMLPTTYLKALARRAALTADSLGDGGRATGGQSEAMIRDYVLCGLLIDRQLDAFVDQLRVSYVSGDSLDTESLPQHYREALTLYNHLRRHPALVYRNPVMEEDFQNLQELERKYPDATERQGKVEDLYGLTYYYYYYYARSRPQRRL